MAESEPQSNDQRFPRAQDQWQDQVLADAIGYTKGLVSILDSLNAGFLRRGRELEEVRQRLTILQNERRGILEERANLEGQLRGLTQEREALQTSLRDRDREIERLQQALAQGQAQLEAGQQESQNLRARLADSVRQVTGLRETVRGLEQQRQEDARLAARLGQTEAELLRARDAATRAQANETRLRELLASTEQRLADAGRELASSQQLAESLRTALDEERSRTEALQERLRLQFEELARQEEALRLSRSTLADIAGILEDPVDVPGGLEDGDEEFDGTALVQGVKRAVEAAAHAQSEFAALQREIESVEAILGTREALSEKVREVLEERALLQQRLGEATLQCQQLQQELADSRRQEQRLQEEQERPSQQALDSSAPAEARPRQEIPEDEREAGWEAPVPGPIRIAEVILEGQGESEAVIAEAPEEPLDEASPSTRAARTWDVVFSALADAAAVPSPDMEESPGGDEQGPMVGKAGDPSHPAAMAVTECTIEAFDRNAPLLLQGQVSEISEIGMVVTLERGVPAGRVLKVRLRRGRQEYVVPGSVVRFQRSALTPSGERSYSHLIRFEHPRSDSVQQLKEFLV